MKNEEQPDQSSHPLKFIPSPMLDGNKRSYERYEPRPIQASTPYMPMTKRSYGSNGTINKKGNLAVSCSSISDTEYEPFRNGKKTPYTQKYSETRIITLEEDKVLSKSLTHLCIGDYMEEDTLVCRYCHAKFDDADGFLVIREGDSLESKGDRYFRSASIERKCVYKVLEVLGQGTFGTVVKCVEEGLKAAPAKNSTARYPYPSSFPNNLAHFRSISMIAYGQKITLKRPEFAIKVIRNVPKYRRAARKELQVLDRIKQASKSRISGCIEYIGAFEFCHHICMVFPLLGCDLFALIEKHQFKGIELSQLKIIARQLFRSAGFLKDHKIIHTDLKPENVMLLDSRLDERHPSSPSTVRLLNPEIQLIDFGSAIEELNYHPEIVSTRHYRAPEIVLGLKWSYPIDIWSIGCILVELLIGRHIFSTHSNGEHLAIMLKFLELESFPMWMQEEHDGVVERKKGIEKYSSVARESPSRKKDLITDYLIHNGEPFPDAFSSLVSLRMNSLSSLLQAYQGDVTKNGLGKVNSLDLELFEDLVRKCLSVDPMRRISPEEAVLHPFVAKY